MSLTNRIPMVAFQTALYKELSEGQDTAPVYDMVPVNAKMPFITLGTMTCKPNGAKTADISDVTQTIDIWSTYRGKKEVNEIANDLITVLSRAAFDLSASHYKVIGQPYVDMFEAFPEEEGGYHGVLIVAAKIQNVYKEE